MIVNREKGTHRWEGRKIDNHIIWDMLRMQCWWNTPGMISSWQLEKMSEKRYRFGFCWVSFVMWELAAWLYCSFVILCHKYLLGSYFSNLALNYLLTALNVVLVQTSMEEYSTISQLWSHGVSSSVSSALITITSVMQKYVFLARLHLSMTSVIFQCPKPFEHLLPFPLSLFFLLSTLLS